MTLTQAMLELKRLSSAIFDLRYQIANNNYITESVVNEEREFDVPEPERLHEIRKSWNSLLALMKQREELQKKITEANARLKIDLLLSRRNVLQKNLEDLNDLKGSNRSNLWLSDEPKRRNEPWTSDKTNYWKHEIMMFAISAKTLDATINSYKSELMQVETEIAIANSDPEAIKN